MPLTPAPVPPVPPEPPVPAPGTAPAPAATAACPIAAVERDTGLSKDTLRVWERRYGFPRPQRDATGERCYSAHEVEQLRALRRLLDAGHRPRHIVGLGLAALQALDPRGPATPVPPGDAADATGWALVRAHDPHSLREYLQRECARRGLGRFVAEVAAPLSWRVGQEWLAGTLEIHEEHLFSACLQQVLCAALATERAGHAPQAPRVLLTTVPQEPHALGLLMAEAMLTTEGCECVPLGPRTPVPDVVRAAAAYRADIVALSFSAVVPPRALATALRELRAALPAGVAVWVGGSHPQLARHAAEGLRVLQDAAQVGQAVAVWRQQAARA